MKKIKAPLLTLALLSTTSLQATGYLGAGVGYTHAGGKITGAERTGANAFNKNVGANGWIGDVHAGHYNHLNPDWFLFEQLAVALDSPRAKGNIATNKAVSMTRLYNISGTLGLGYKFAPMWNAYVKAGVANAAIRFRDRTTPTVSFEHTKNLWGFLSGVGINKVFSTYTVGLDYEYTRYQGAKYAYQGVNALHHTANLKRPTYHTVMVKFSKAF